MTGSIDLSCRKTGPVVEVKKISNLENYTAYQKRLLLLADGDYVAARVLYYFGSFYLVVIRLLREALEKYLKLLYLLLAAVPDSEADSRLRKFDHRLERVASECARLAKGDLRFTSVLTHPQFLSILKMSDDAKYETVTRYPAAFAVPGNIFKLFERRILNIRCDLLDLHDNPADRVIDTWKDWPDWRPVDKATVRTAFHYANKRFPPQMSTATRQMFLRPRTHHLIR